MLRLKKIYKRLIQSVREDGFLPTYMRIRRQLHSKFGRKTYKYSWVLKKSERMKQEKRIFDGTVISILIPIYNTPLQSLNDMLDSVQAQTCKHYELCLADCSDATHSEIGDIIRARAQNDKSIHYVKLPIYESLSISTNACKQMATGTHYMLMNQDGLLHPSAVFFVMEAIEQTGADFLYTDEATFKKHPKVASVPHFKQDFSPDTLRSHNYISHLIIFSRQLEERVCTYRPEFNGVQDYDSILSLTEKAQKIVHIPRILYYWRTNHSSITSNIDVKPFVFDDEKAALKHHLERVGIKGEVMDTMLPSIYRINYALEEEALVSIIIPTSDHLDELQKCISSIIEKTNYGSYEIVIVENNSREKRTFDYYDTLKNDMRIRLLVWSGSFNYSAINNYAANYASGKYLLFLNNDTEVLTPNWITEMLMFAQRQDVGAVGAKLYYPDGRVQHAGIGIGLLTLAGHFHRGFPRNANGYMGRLQYQQNVSAVTGACLMMRKQTYCEIGGMEEELPVNFNDVDLCMRIREMGLLIVFTPFAELIHYESTTRNIDETPEKRKRYLQEESFFRNRWAQQLENGDPYFSPNFDPLREDFSFR